MPSKSPATDGDAAISDVSDVASTGSAVIAASKQARSPFVYARSEPSPSNSDSTRDGERRVSVGSFLNGIDDIDSADEGVYTFPAPKQREAGTTAVLSPALSAAKSGELLCCGTCYPFFTCIYY